MLTLREIRQQNGYRQLDIVKATGWSQSRVSRIETTPLNHLRMETIQRYIEACNGYVSLNMTLISQTMPSQASTFSVVL